MNLFLTKFKLKACSFSIAVIALIAMNPVMFARQPSYKDGIQLGVVKVKFEESMTSTLSRMPGQIQTVGKKSLTTGMTAFDKVAGSVKASKMERLIPVHSDPEIEARHVKAGLHLWYLVEFDEGIDPSEAAKKFKSVSGIKIVEREHLKAIIPSTYAPYKPSPSVYSASIFDDPYLKDQWHYINTGQLNLPGKNADTNLGEAWKITAGRSDVIVAVFDEGVDVNHEDLKENIWINTKEIPGNGIDDDGNGYIDDINGFNFSGLTGKIDPQRHATHVAGTVAAVNNNGKGVAGVAGGTGANDGAKVMSMQIMSATAGQMFRAYVYAADQGAVISQNSWGYQSPGVLEQDVLYGIDYFIDHAGSSPNSPMKGGIVIFAAGNATSDGLWWPGVYNRCLSVAAIGPEGKIASYSNYGNWIEISAPGGDDQVYGAKGGVLSTFPGNQYGYISGTSMACPHVSGIAALAIANSKTQMTNTKLWNLLLTSVTDVYGYNEPKFEGKMGTGMIDAALAVREDGKIAPDKITTLKVRSVAQELAILEWNVPNDLDDDTPYIYTVYYSTEPVTPGNKDDADKTEVMNSKKAGEVMEHEISGLFGTTKYYFAIISTDRWGNVSEISNVTSATTNNGPKIDVNTGETDKSLKMTIDVSQNTMGSKSFKLLNNDEGLLRWEYVTRNTSYTYSTTPYSAPVYPVVTGSPKGIGTINAESSVETVRNAEIIPFAAFTPVEKRYSGYTQLYIGDIDSSLPTSGAVHFFVNEESGFNLTHVNASFRYTMGTGPVIIEVYKGAGLTKENLIYSQNYQPANAWNTTHNIQLAEHCYFAKGADFFIVVHIPGGNQYPLGIGVETSEEYSDYCFYSSDYGKNWAILYSVGVSVNYAWNIAALSNSQHLEKYMELNPMSGDVDGNSQADITLLANASTLINGTYNARLIFKSNDNNNPEFRVPTQINVVGHKAKVTYPTVANFGSVFVSDEKTLDIVLENKGYGITNTLTAVVDNTQYEIVSVPNTVAARNEATIRIKMKPTAPGNINGRLTVTDGQNKYIISLFGVGAETSKITMTPSSSTIDNINIGDILEATFTLKNEGAYPLLYFMPGLDNSDISTSWPVPYHKYGYVTRSNRSDLTKDATLVYSFNDISATGVDITSNYISNHYKEIELGFRFPFYGVDQEKIYITKNGFTTFDNSAFPYNRPKLKGDLKGYISLLGLNSAANLTNGSIHYKMEPDRFILQYTNIGYGTKFMTAQMVLYATGDIRFYYEKMPPAGQEANAITILIEDIAQTDGIAFRDYISQFAIEDYTVIGFDYPGPDIITTVENGSGVIAPNNSVDVKITMNTATLPEGTSKRSVNVISNDPDNQLSSYQATLNVVSGGLFGYKTSSDVVDFGVAFQGYPYEKSLMIQNTGTKPITISSLDYDNTKFNVTGNMEIVPGLNVLLNISVNTDNLAEFDEVLKINFSEGTSKSIGLKASVRVEPIIQAETSLLSATLNRGEKEVFPYEIKNTGGSDLDVSVIGGQWFRFEEAPASNTITEYNYFVKKENSGEPSYNWIDIMGTGIKFPYDAGNQDNKEKFWNKIELPFKFKFYGIEYDSIRVGNNGIIALGGDPLAMTWTEDDFPIIGAYGASFICPLWSSGGFDSYNHPGKSGLYYQAYEDKVVFSWMYYKNLFGWGQSMQAILFKDGTIKFMYQAIPGVSSGTGSGLVGIQNVDGKYTTISVRSVLDLGKGLAYLILPSDIHTIAPGASINGEMVIDSENIYGGNFTDKFQIHSNAPASQVLNKPVSVSVLGNTTVDNIPQNIAFEDLDVYLDISTGLYNSVIKEFVINNTSDFPINITNARMKTGQQNLTMLVEMIVWGLVELTPIENLMSFPQKVIMPGAQESFLVRFEPTVAGSFNDVLVLSTDIIGDVEIEMSGLGYYPAVLNVDTTPIDVSFDNLNQTLTKIIPFDNIGGGYKLNYDVYVNYKRNNIAPASKANMAAQSITPEIARDVKTKIQPAAKSPMNTNLDFNRKYQYITGYNNSLGNNGTTLTLAATRFTADNTGFNLSDVGSAVNLKKGVEGTIKVEIKAGGTGINNAVLVGTGSINFKYPEGTIDNETVVLLNVPLDKPVQIMPNEDFYVIFIYPMDLNYPQCLQLDGAEEMPNRYFWFSNGDWLDLQALMAADGYPVGTGYTMYAAEREFKESGWVKILSPSPALGTLPIDGSASAEIKIDGSFAERGIQNAELVFKSIAKKDLIEKLPISLAINEAPVFVGMPTVITISEKDDISIDVVVNDKEGDTFVIEVTEKPTFVSLTEGGSGNKKITLKPDYGDSGDYRIVIKVKDEHNAENEHVIDIHVAKTNRAPEYTGDNELNYNLGLSFIRMNINDLFSDPDGDEFTFTVTSSDKTVADVYVSSSFDFVIEPKASGQTQLTFDVTDTNGARTNKSVDVVIAGCLPFDTYIVQKWNSALVVRNTDNIFVTYQWYKNGLPINGATKQYYTSGVGELDFDAFYFVEITTTEGETVFTCPVQPVRKEASMMMYPNMVRQGESVTVVTQLPDLDENPVSIKIINISGNLLSNIVTDKEVTSLKMDYPAGAYLIEVSNSNTSKTFNVLVK